MATSERQAQVYEAYYRKVLAYARARVSSAADAEDLTSEIFIKVFSALDGYDERKASLSTWIYAIARNHIYDFYRVRRLETLPYDDELDSGMSDPIGEAQDAWALLEKLDRALDTLPERQREIVILRYYFELPHKEIAERMKLSYVNTRQLCYVAVGALRKHMAKEEDEDDGGTDIRGKDRAHGRR